MESHSGHLPAGMIHLVHLAAIVSLPASVHGTIAVRLVRAVHLAIAVRLVRVVHLAVAARFVPAVHLVLAIRLATAVPPAVAGHLATATRLPTAAHLLAAVPHAMPARPVYLDQPDPLVHHGPVVLARADFQVQAVALSWVSSNPRGPPRASTCTLLHSACYPQ